MPSIVKGRWKRRWMIAVPVARSAGTREARIPGSNLVDRPPRGRIAAAGVHPQQTGAPHRDRPDAQALPVLCLEAPTARIHAGARLRVRHDAAVRGRLALALQVRVEEIASLAEEGADDAEAVATARVAQVSELKRDARAGRRRERSVHAQRLGGGEEVVGPAVLHEERRAWATQAGPAVKAGQLPADGKRVGACGLAAISALLPGREVRVERAALRCVEAAEGAQEIETVVVALLHHPARSDALVRFRRPEIEEAAIRLKRVGEVRGGPARIRRGDLERRPVRARPALERAVGQPDAVAKASQVEALDAAVGDARHAECVGLGHALVHQQAEQVLRVAGLVAVIRKMEPAGVAARARARVRPAA